MDPKHDNRYRKHPRTSMSWSYPSWRIGGWPRNLAITGDAPVHRKLGRNDPCWCGSGKKYKHCHLDEDLRE
jgi:uncharacterized protein YecA (UPF0149 family)